DAKRAEVGARLDARPGLSPDIVGRLDRVAREWATARVQACTRSSDVPTEAAPPRVRCLERSAATIAATIDTLATADDKTFDRARELVRSLDDPRRCQQRRPDDGTPAPTDPSRSSVVDPLRQQLMVFGVARKAGRLGAQVDAVEDLVERARAVGFDPVYAEALLMHGRAQQGAGRFEEAAALCEEAYWLAARTAYEPVMVDSALCSTRIRGARLGQTEVALDWARQAEASLERQGWPPEGAARLSDIVAGIHAAQGDTQTALRHHERALEIYATMEVPAPRLWSSALNNYANALADAGRVSEGVEALRRAIPMLARELGPGQPVPTVMRCSLGSLLSDLGEPAAIDELTACVEGLEGNIPADHVWLVQGRANLGLALRLAGQHERAAEQMAEALRGAQTVPGAAGADVRVGIGTNLGDLLLLMGRLDDARERLRVAQRVAHDELGRTDPRTLLAAVKLALVEARSDRAAAVGRLRETLAVATDAEAADGIALTRFELARLVYPDDPAEAGALAHAAREHWRTRPPSRSVIAPFPSSAQEYRDVIDRWWAEHASD
ncbi:MAG: tetratricopeptide repeat protein, partial [Deltaproteobacteria bacterium]|nr:tetratricopeptide repeat protein [Deltaproteobacteria bacterium]